jgi:hypothetical protein
MSRGTLACLLSDSNFKVRPFFVFFRHTLSLCSCERGPISQTVVFQGGFFCLGRSFPFPSLIGFFSSGSFCQALAEDRVTTPTKKKI